MSYRRRRQGMIDLTDQEEREKSKRSLMKKKSKEIEKEVDKLTNTRATTGVHSTIKETLDDRRVREAISGVDKMVNMGVRTKFVEDVPDHFKDPSGRVPPAFSHNGINGGQPEIYVMKSDDYTLDEYRALTLHEYGHLKLTAFAKEMTNHPIKKQIFNVTEDIRLEATWKALFPNYSRHFQGIVDKKMKFSNMDRHPISTFGLALMQIRSLQHMGTDYQIHYSDRVLKRFAERMKEIVDEIHNSGSRSYTTQQIIDNLSDTFRKYVKFCKDLNDWMNQQIKKKEPPKSINNQNVPPMPQPPSDDSSDDDQQKSDEPQVTSDTPQKQSDGEEDNPEGEPSDDQPSSQQKPSPSDETDEDEEGEGEEGKQSEPSDTSTEEDEDVDDTPQPSQDQPSDTPDDSEEDEPTLGDLADQNNLDDEEKSQDEPSTNDPSDGEDEEEDVDTNEPQTSDGEGEEDDQDPSSDTDIDNDFDDEDYDDMDDEADDEWNNPSSDMSQEDQLPDDLFGDDDDDMDMDMGEGELDPDEDGEEGEPGEKTGEQGGREPGKGNFADEEEEEALIENHNNKEVDSFEELENVITEGIGEAIKKLKEATVEKDVSDVYGKIRKTRKYGYEPTKDDWENARSSPLRFPRALAKLLKDANRRVSVDQGGFRNPAAPLGTKDKAYIDRKRDKVHFTIEICIDTSGSNQGARLEKSYIIGKTIFELFRTKASFRFSVFGSEYCIISDDGKKFPKLAVFQRLGLGGTELLGAMKNAMEDVPKNRVHVFVTITDGQTSVQSVQSEGGAYLKQDEVVRSFFRQCQKRRTYALAIAVIPLGSYLELFGKYALDASWVDPNNNHDLQKLMTMFGDLISVLHREV